jgi:hypothetical protein
MNNISKDLYMQKNKGSFQSALVAKAPLLDKRSKASVLSNISNPQVQARFRALHPKILFVEISDSYFGCPNHNSLTHNKNHKHGPGCSVCLVMHSHHENLCDSIKVVIEGSSLSSDEAASLKPLIRPLMLEIFDFVPFRNDDDIHSFDEYDEDCIDSRITLSYWARE